jgi:hypothetical protein
LTVAALPGRKAPGPSPRSSTTMPLQRFAPLGRCMYCLANGVKLSEEHLIPKCLGGRLTLRDAVCEPCRVGTGRLEQATLDRDFIVPRTLLALKRRRARGKGPSRLPSLVLSCSAARGTDGGPLRVALDAGEFPRSFTLPAFEPAGLLAQTDRTQVAPGIEFVNCRLQLGNPSRETAASVQPLADPQAYAYSIAKWAYGLAVAHAGLGCCDTRAIRQLLVSERHDAFNFVGTPHPRQPAARDRLHRATLRENGAWLTVVLDLLGSAGMPPYEIVIGALPSPRSA